MTGSANQYDAWKVYILRVLRVNFPFPPLSPAMASSMQQLKSPTRHRSRSKSPKRHQDKRHSHSHGQRHSHGPMHKQLRTLKITSRSLEEEEFCLHPGALQNRE